MVISALILLLLFFSSDLVRARDLQLDEEEILKFFLRDISPKVTTDLIANSYRTSAGEILTTVSDSSLQWSLAIISFQGDSAANAAAKLAHRGLFYQFILTDLEEIRYSQAIKNELAHYLLAQHTDYSFSSITEKITMEYDGRTAVLIAAPVKDLNYQVNYPPSKEGFHQYLVSKAEFLNSTSQIEGAVNRLEFVASESRNKSLQLIALLKSAEIYSENGVFKSVRSKLDELLLYSDLNIYNSYGLREFKILVHLLSTHHSHNKAIEMAAFALALFPEESYFIEIISGQ